MNSNVKVLAILPLRLKSVRIPKKVLKNLGSGKNQKPLCVWSVQKVLNAFGANSNVQVLAAVDDVETKAVLLKEFPKLDVVLTDPKLPSGTDRVFAAAQDFLKRHLEAKGSLKGIINIQGDMPFMGPDGIVALADFFIGASSGDLVRAPMLTLCEEWPETKGASSLTNPAAVKVILNKDSFAIYFSRHPIPYSREKSGKGAPKGLAKYHLGVYGYTLEGLTRFCMSPQHPYEVSEGLEQLRALWLGIPIFVIPTQSKTGESYRGIDTPDDFKWAQSFSKTLFQTKKTKGKK